MASKKLLKALNEQLNFELESAYVYMGMEAYMAREDWPGFAHFFREQYKEEYEHAMKFFDFIHDMDGEVEYREQPKPQKDYKDPLEVFSTALEHEKLVSQKIRDLMDMAVAEKSYETVDFLKWFISEQVEEENTFKPIVNTLEKNEGKFTGLYMLDKELGQR